MRLIFLHVFCNWQFNFCKELSRRILYLTVDLIVRPGESGNTLLCYKFIHGIRTMLITGDCNIEAVLSFVLVEQFKFGARISW